MNVKRAVILAAVLWLSSFVVGIAVIGLSGGSNPFSAVSDVFVILVILVLLAASSVYYFRGKKTEKSAREGVLLGILFIVVASVLDTLSLIPFVIYGGNLGEIASYYLSVSFLMAVLLTAAVPAVVGYYLGRTSAKR